MQVVVPMSGFGERFRRAGYTIPKPLIEIDGKPIIAHVIDMFPGEQDFLFICNSDHLATASYRMEEILKRYCPTGRVVGIPPHNLGPVHAVRQVEHLLDPNRPVIVNYCDFTCYWDWDHFKQWVVDCNCDGAIPAYKGFHPHSLGSTNYAYIRETDGWVQDIQEKLPYTDDRMREYASSGTYYFASGQIMSGAFQIMIEQNLNLGSEFYVSLAYRQLIESHRPVAVYPLQHFMQWGTPEDVAEYNGWSHAFRQLCEPQPHSSRPIGSIVLPMAGFGQRFVNEGYLSTKPLIPVSGKPMVLQAVIHLPVAQQHAFVLRTDMPGYEEITNTIKVVYPDAVIKTISGMTEGQACTALIGLDALVNSLENVPGPITFGACDYGALYDLSVFQTLVDDPTVDVIVWAVRGHANAARHPKMYGWIDEMNGTIRRISVKSPLESPATDPIVLGTFTFRRTEDFRKVVAQLIGRDGRINGEFYLDSCINDAIALGLKCQLFEVDSFMSWGTPNDLRTFEYWQSCFDKWERHSYKLEKDARVDSDALELLKKRYIAAVPLLLGVK